MEFVEEFRVALLMAICVDWRSVGRRRGREGVDRNARHAELEVSL